ncbi:MAG: Autotransporter-associated beta strand repeat protein [Pedosphaera sp.]|nr:Autotransporter-associated beta strand repeat protein [Pedosphaera sp.]
MKNLMKSQPGCFLRISALTLAALAVLPTPVTRAADIFWSGNTASYTNAANWGGIVPGATDNAINDNGATNVVQINLGNPDWTVADLSAGSTGSAMGAFEQNGQTVTANGWFHLGAGVDSTGFYTLNGGTLNVLSGRLFLGEGAGSTSTLTINGGVLNKAGDVFVIADGGWNGSGARVGTVTQNGGTVNSSSEIWIGQVALGTGIYNLHAGGTINSTNWFVIGRSGSDGTMNMDGGSMLQVSGGTPAFIVADGGTGTLNHSGGAIATTAGEFWIGNGGGSLGTNNMSGTAVLNVNNWIAIGRGGVGVLNLSGGSINKTGNGNIVVSGSGLGIINQTGGSFTSSSGEVWLPEGGTGIWNLSGGTALVGMVQICRNNGALGTLNLDGGSFSAAEITTGNAGGYSALYLNGGVLSPTSSSANFLHDLSQAFVSAGGAIFNTAGFDITVPQALIDNGGGLTKNGAGTLTLTGANSYSGPTIVNAGKLAITTGSAAGGNYSLNNNADLGVTVPYANAQISMANLALTGSPAASLDVDLGAFGNPASAPINVGGTLTINGTITVNIADTLPQIGQFPLIQYGSRTGSGNFVIGSLPVGVAATIVNNTANNSVDIKFTSVNLPRWDGLAGGNWDIGLTTNWVNIGNNQPTTFGQGNAVTFNDSAAGTTSVNITTTVNPSAITVNNSSLPYTFTGAGKISGNVGISKQGSGTLAIVNSGGNNYTGPTVISGGTVSVTNLANGGSPSAIGASSASPTNLVLANGMLTYAGPSVSVNRGYTLQGTGSAIDTENNLTLSGLAVANPGSSFTKAGPAQLTYATVGSNALSGSASPGYLVQNGTVLFDGSNGAQTNTIQGQLGVVGLPGINAALVLTNSTLIVSGRIELGNSNNATGTLTIKSGAVLSAQGSPMALGDGGGAPSAGVVNQTGGTLESAGELWLGQNTSGVGAYNLSGGVINLHNWLAIGRRGGNGTFTMSGGTFNKNGNGNFIIGTGGAGSFGLLQQSAGTINSQNEYWLAENGGTEATNNISGSAVLNLSNWMSIGRGGHGVINFSGGTINKTGGGNFIVGDGGNGYFNQTGGTLTSGNDLWIGQAGGATGQYDLSGTGTVTINSWIAIGREGANGTLNISGGSMTKGGGGNISIAHGGGTGTINQTGGAFTSTTGETWISEDSNTGTWNLGGGTATFGVVHLAQSSSATGIINLTGGTLTAVELTTGNTGGTSTLNLNGGTLAAGANNTNFLHNLTAANVLTGGVVINSGTNVISIAQALLDGTGGGGLTKIGSGTLRLNGVNTYVGPTLVNAGALGGSGTIAGPVNVASGATFAPGASIGTLTINNTLTLSAGSSTLMEISLEGGVTNQDQVVGLSAVTYAGSLVVTNVGSNALAGGSVFKLFNSATAGSGNFSSVTILPTGTGTFNPTTGELTITSSAPPVVNPPKVSGGNLIFTGTGGTPGGSYTWLTSTNVAAPMANWITNSVGVFSGTGTFSNAIPVTSEASRFFRLKTP